MDAFYPPLAPLAAAVSTIGFPPKAATSTWALNQLSLGLLLFATYRLGRRAAGRSAGIAAAIAVTTFPGVFNSAHGFMLDLPVTAVTAMALEQILASERFSRGTRSLLFGLLCGVGMLTKWTFLFFLLVPFAVELTGAALLPDRGRRMRNAGAAVLAGLLVSLPWYLTHAPRLAQELLGYGPTSAGDWRNFPPVVSLASLTFYLRAIPALLFLPWFAALLVGGALAWRKSPRARQLFLYSVSSLLFLTLFRTKDARYPMPALPGIAVLATAWAGTGGGDPRVRRLAMAGLAAASLALAFRADPPIAENWRIEEALGAVSGPPRADGFPLCVRVIPDLPAFHRFAFEYAARAQGRDTDVVGAGRFPWFTDGVIVKTGGQGARPGPAEITARIESNEGHFREVFRRTWEGTLPDGGRAEAWRRDVRPVAGVAPGELVERLRAAVVREIASVSRGTLAGRIEIDAASDEETLRGRFPRIAFSASDFPMPAGSAGDPPLNLREVGFELVGAAVNPYRLAEGTLEVFSIDELVPHLVLREEDANRWLRASARYRDWAIAFREGSLRAAFRRKGEPSLDVAVAPRIAGAGNIGFDVQAVRVAGIPFPVFLASALASQYNPILKEMPCRVRFATLACERGLLTISGRR